MEQIKLHMEPHTKAKHAILEKYLKGWFPILSRWNGRILYLDAYSGSGVYDSGDIGSPIIALNVAREHSLQGILSKSEKWFYFIEKDKATFETLHSVIEAKFGKVDTNGHPSMLPEDFKVIPINEDFNIEFKQTLDDLEKRDLTLAPTFAFVDPYGYSLDLDLLSRIIAYPKCEVLLNFMVGFLNRFLFADEHLKAILRTFSVSKEKIMEIRQIPDESKREDELGKLLFEAMKRKIGPSGPLFMISFEMIDNHNRPLYRLVYFTRNKRGMEVMKDAMFKIGGEGNYRFSDFNFNPSQTSILDYADGLKPWVIGAAEYVSSALSNQDLTIEQFKDYVTLLTPYIYRAKILKHLEDSGKLEVYSSEKRRPGTYPPGCSLRFI